MMCDAPPTTPQAGYSSLFQSLPPGTLRGGTSTKHQVPVTHLSPFSLCQANTGNPFCSLSGTSYCPSSMTWVIAVACGTWAAVTAQRTRPWLWAERIGLGGPRSSLLFLPIPVCLQLLPESFLSHQKSLVTSKPFLNCVNLVTKANPAPLRSSPVQAPNPIPFLMETHGLSQRKPLVRATQCT